MHPKPASPSSRQIVYDAEENFFFSRRLSQAPSIATAVCNNNLAAIAFGFPTSTPTIIIIVTTTTTTRTTMTTTLTTSTSHLFLLVLAGTLRLGGTTELLGSVLPLLALLSAGLLDLGGVADSDESVVGFELLHRLDAVVDEGEAGRLAATVLRPHAEHIDLVLVRLVHLGESGAQVILGDVGAVGVEDIAVKTRRLASDHHFYSLAWTRHMDVRTMEFGFQGAAYTTICLRDRSRLVMNLRVRMVTGASAMIAILDV